MRKTDWISLFILGCGGIVALVALTVMSGWVKHDTGLIELLVSYAPMQFNTALCFLLCAAGIICLHLKAMRLGAMLAILCTCFAFFTFLQYPLGNDYGIDTLFVQPFTSVHVAFIGRMAPNTALGFILGGIAICLCSFSESALPRKAFFAALFASLVMALGAVPLLGYVCGVAAAYSWGNIVHMVPHTSACFILLGSSILAYSWRSSSNWQQWLPFPILIGMIAATIALAGAVRSQEDVDFQNMLQSESDHIAQESQARLTELYKALERIAIRWQASGGTPKDLWESDAQAYLSSYPFLSGLSHTDTDSSIIWIASRTTTPNTKKAFGFHLNSEPTRAQAVRKAIATRSSQTTPTIDLINNGGKGFLYVTPLYSHDHYDGLQVAVFHIDSFFTSILAQKESSRFYISVEDSGRIFSTLPPGQEHHWPWVKQTPFRSQDTSWIIAVSPTPELLKSRNSNVPLVLLLVGFFTSGLVTLCVFLTLKWRENAHTLRLHELALQESNRINDAILSSAAYLIVATDLTGKIITFNREAERTLGYRAEEVVGKLTPALWHDKQEVRQRAEEMSRETGETITPGFEVFVRKARESGSEQREWTYMRKNGSRFPAELLVTPLKDVHQHVVGYLGIIQDITERRRQQDALRKSEETIRLAFEKSPIGVALVSPSGAFLQVNKALCSIVGYNREELLRLDFQSITHPDDLNADLQYFYKLLAGEMETYRMEKRYICKDGKIVIIDLNVTIVRNENGTPAYFITQIQDITERKQAEIELKSSEAFNRGLMEASADCVDVLDTHGRLLKMNNPGRSIREIDDSDVVCGREWWTLWPRETQMEVKNSVAVAAAGGEYRFQAFCPTAKGAPKWWDVQVSPVCDPDGNIVHLLSVSRDITYSKEVERMKTEFISTVSHELRTPLTSIRGSLGLIIGGIAGQLPEKARDLLQIAHKNSERLVRLINNMLDIEKIESGQMTFQFETVSVAALLKHAVEEIHGYTEKYQVTVKLEMDTENAQVNGDYDRLLQVLGNLISNAVKYSPPGGTVTVATRNSGGRIRIGIEDRGPGIPEAFKARIFGKFAQADSSDTRQKGGTGLGLSISHAIIESMGGTIDFESAPGRTEFFFTLPELLSKAAHRKNTISAQRNILICEDDPDIAALLQMILQKEGFASDIAVSAAEARRKLSEKPFAAMTLDLGLPDENGLTFIRELRTHEDTLSLPIIVISSSAEQGRKALSGEAISILDWCPKPIDIDRIRRVLKSLISGRKTPLILHVEDDEDIVQVIEASLNTDAEIIAASSLSEARALLGRYRFDLAILDQHLPDGNGLSLLPELAERSLPVIILSVDETPREIQEKVVACLVKSVVSEEKIVQAIRSFVLSSKEAA